MADLNNTVSPVESPGAFYPQDFTLNKINILTSAGQRFEMRQLMVELSYYEDIYTFAVSGYVTVKDAQGFIEGLQLTGNEFIELNFGKVKGATNTDDQVFRLYKIGDRKPGFNLNMETYTLYFCSEELMLSEQIKISKSFTGKKISDIVSNILTDQLKVASNKIQVIEPTTGIYDFIIPRMKPFEAISWVSTYARPQKTGGKGADMLFFETRNGFNYRSLQSMYADSIYATYRYQQSNLDDKTQPFQDKAISVLNYEFAKTYDVLKDINSGTYANKLISIDPIARKVITTNFDVSQYNSQATELNKNAPLNPAKNRLGVSQNQAYDSVVKVATSNAFQPNSAYIKQAPGSVAKDIGIENYVPLRTAQLNLANYTVIKMTIPGDPGITAGRTIQFNLLSIKPTTQTRELDKFYSGKYLVTAVRHIIQPEGVYQTVLEVAKGSSPTGSNSVNNNDPTYQMVIKE